jgi:hypothetical protein
MTQIHINFLAPLLSAELKRVWGSMLLFWFQFVIPIQKNERNIVFYWTFCYFIFNEGKSEQGRATYSHLFSNIRNPYSKVSKNVKQNSRGGH